MKDIMLHAQMSKEFEWEKWQKEIPYLTFPEHLEVKVIPPFQGAIVRFLVRSKEYHEANVSIYLDCYSILGASSEPYWEIYPYEEDVFRCGMNETEELIEGVEYSIRGQITSIINEKCKDKGSKFYTFTQNNSGGYFDNDDNVCELVIIEAKSVEQVNNKALDVGIYFNGVDTGEDCSCCGDRWSEMWDEDGGKEVPMIYNTPVKEAGSSIFRDKCIIHYLNGEKEIMCFR